MKRTTISALALLVIAGLFGGACAEERAPIDRVQPYALPKTFFIGEDFQSVDDDPEFWSQNTLIDVGYGAAQSGLFTSTYAQPMSRLKWQITEDLLIGRAAYERIEGSDGKGIATGFETQDGIVVCAFPITSHFDIVNAYNPTTGEKLNVLEENSYDRPWYEREYVRVDWSKNQATDAYDFDTLSVIGVYGGITYEPLSYYVSDPQDEQAPYFDLENGYFDVTTKAFAKPGMIDLSHLGWGIDAFPACYLDADFFGGSYPEGTCNPVEITLRHSFRQVVDDDFQPMEYDGWRFQAFGGFQWTERMGYERNYGMTDGDHHRFLSRFQIWQRAHYYGNEWETGEWVPAEDGTMSKPVACYTPDTTPAGADPNRDEDGNGTADECEAVTDLVGYAGSQCDHFTQKCTLPFRARTPRTMAWYYATPTDHRFFEPSDIATHNWDVALRTAVRAAQYSECMTAGGGAESCARDWPMYFGQQGANDDAIRLGMEMDDCRHGRTHPDLDGDEDACGDMVDDLAQAQGAVPGVAEIARMDEMIVLCHSPVEVDDHPACAPEEERLPEGITAEMCSNARKDGDRELLEICLEARNVRRGDLRYHLVNVIEEPQTPSPWGIMTSATDPLNGQTVQSCVNVWAWVNDFWAQRLVDYMRFAAGELSTEEVTDGEYIKDWTQAARAAEHGGMARGLTRAEFDKRIGAFLGRSFESAKVSRDPDFSHPALQELARAKQEMTGVLADAREAPTMTAKYQTRMNALAGSGIEADLMNDQMRELYGVDELSMTEGVLDLTSPVRGGNLTIRRDMELMKQNAMAERGMCELEMASAPVSINGLSKILQKKFGDFGPEDSKEQQWERAQDMIDYIARRVHMSVIVHEMGHSMAHRHNFVGSSDAYNYRPQYWQLRTKDKSLDGSYADDDLIDPTGETTLGPRWFDPVSDTEADNLIWMWSHSSVMDYAGEATQDFLGLGAWDFAALRMFYGDTVSVYPLDYAGVGQPGLAGYRAEGIQMKLDNFGGILGLSYNLDMDNELHYTKLDEYFDMIQDCHAIGDAGETREIFQPARYDAERDGVWHPVLDGEIVAPDGDTYTRCRQQKVDYVPWRTLRAPNDSEWPTDQYGNRAYLRSATDDGRYGGVVDDLGRVRVPYGFATDRWADLGNASVYRHDNGADTYEIFNFFMSQQELFHIFDNYRRGRLTFSVSGAAGRINGRYNGKIRDGAKGLALQRNYIKIRGAQLGVATDLYWDFAAANWFPDNILASGLVFDHFVRTAQRPEVGPHVLPSWGQASSPIIGEVLRSTEDAGYVNGGTQVTIPDGAYGTDGGFTSFSSGGKLVENRLDPTQGEYESEYTLNAGSYYDKVWSAMMMTESVDNFISDSRGDFVDKRYRATSLADLFPEGYRRWLANNLTNDEFLKGARIAADATGNPIVDSQGWPVGGIGTTQWWGETPQACFPKNGTNVCSEYNGNWDMSDAPQYVVPIESQLGWESQKYLIAWTYIYLPENDQQWWKDMMWVWDISLLDDDVIGLDNRIELHYPDGRSYVARRFGTEEIFGKTVQRGIGSRVLEYANELLYDAYETTEVDFDSDGTVDWYEVVRDSTGQPVVRFDPKMVSLAGGPPAPGECDETSNAGCTCEMNSSCLELEEYMAIVDWMWWFSGVSCHGVDGWDDMIGIYG